MNFKNWFENKIFQGITPGDIKWLSNYASLRKFSTEQEARNWIFNHLQRSDSANYAPMFGINGPEYNRAFADNFPIYQSGKSYKIGKRIRTDNRLKLRDLQVKIPDWEYIVQTAQANGTEDFKVYKVKWIPIRFTVADQNDYYLTNQLNRLQNLADQIKNNKWIEAVIYDYDDLHIIEGQHRARAMKLLGFNTVPGVGIKYEL